jgi:hypothetical protein
MKELAKINWFFRPYQTVHRYATKWMDKELLRTSRTNLHNTSDIIGKCLVLYVKDFIRGYLFLITGKAKGFEPEHVYVCESRYNETAKTISKIKNWQSSLPESTRNSEPDLEIFTEHLVLNRVCLPDETGPDPNLVAIAKRRRDEEDIADNSKRRVSAFKPDYSVFIYFKIRKILIPLLNLNTIIQMILL